MRFIYFQMEKNILEYKNIIIDLFYKAVKILNYEIKKNVMILYFDEKYSGLEELIRSFANDIYQIFFVYVSANYKRLEKLKEAILLFEAIKDDLNSSEIYFDNKVLLKQSNIDINKLKKLILGDFEKNAEMIKTVLVFLENNQNGILASNKLYLHRNTLNLRLEKFYLETDFDVKKFIDGYYVYKILK